MDEKKAGRRGSKTNRAPLGGKGLDGISACKEVRFLSFGSEGKRGNQGKGRAFERLGEGSKKVAQTEVPDKLGKPGEIQWTRRHPENDRSKIEIIVFL